MLKWKKESSAVCTDRLLEVVSFSTARNMRFFQVRLAWEDRAVDAFALAFEVPTMSRRQPLTIEQILQWADAYFLRLGRWPRGGDGPIALAPGETWAKVSEALTYGSRGLPGGSSLALLLNKYRGSNPKSSKPLLRVEQIVAWADAHFQRTGEWPTKASGPVVDAPGETWSALNSALTDGNRGLPGGSSLLKLRRWYQGR